MDIISTFVRALSTSCLNSILHALACKDLSKVDCWTSASDMDFPHNVWERDFDFSDAQPSRPSFVGLGAMAMGKPSDFLLLICQWHESRLLFGL